MLFNVSFIVVCFRLIVARATYQFWLENRPIAHKTAQLRTKTGITRWYRISFALGCHCRTRARMSITRTSLLRCDVICVKLSLGSHFFVNCTYSMLSSHEIGCKLVIIGSMFKCLSSVDAGSSRCL